MIDQEPYRNPLKSSWQEGKQTVNGWLAIPSNVTAEVMAHQGWDSLTFDMQHGLVDYTDTLPMLAAISTTPKRLVNACRYPPQGIRSFGPIRKGIYAGPNYYKTANEEVLSFAMIETLNGLDNLEDILSVDGLSGVYVGPADLSMALGCTPKFDQEEKPVIEAIERVVKTAHSKGKWVGVHNLTPEYALKNDSSRDELCDNCLRLKINDKSRL